MADKEVTLLPSLKKAAAVLRDADISFAVAGGFTAWARGGTASLHDVDLMIAEADADRALEAMAAAGMRTDRPPEGWLVKAWDGEVLIDLIYGPAGVSGSEELMKRADVMQVEAMTMPVITANDLLVTKLAAMGEHALDYEGVLRAARELREQVDWDDVRECTADSPFARAFFSLAEDLGIVPPPSGRPS
ncbi:MAG TPA: nucleotidyltransferase [Acidimicrobiales bacterium]|nr:nucleotidyltransferase [Acidimicrobiales bacterium]